MQRTNPKIISQFQLLCWIAIFNVTTFNTLVYKAILNSHKSGVFPSQLMIASPLKVIKLIKKQVTP